VFSLPSSPLQASYTCTVRLQTLLSSRDWSSFRSRILFLKVTPTPLIYLHCNTSKASLLKRLVILHSTWSLFQVHLILQSSYTCTVRLQTLPSLRDWSSFRSRIPFLKVTPTPLTYLHCNISKASLLKRLVVLHFTFSLFQGHPYTLHIPSL
jgi:hypothetical protein